MLKLTSIAAVMALALAGTVQAQQTRDPAATPRTDAGKPAKAERRARNAEEERIEAEYKAAKEKCDALKANAKDVCEKEAKAHEKVAKAELAAKNNPSQRNQRRVAEAKAEGEYDVAKEKCDDMKGEQKDACEKDAKAKRDQAKAQISKQYAQRKDADRPARSTTSGGTSAGSTAGSGK